MKEKYNMIISVGTEKIFDKIHDMIETLSKLGIEENFLNMIKSNYEKPTANIIFNVERWKAFPLRSGTRQGCLLSPLLFNFVLKVLPRPSKEEKTKI